MLKFLSYDIVFQEVPGEITLAINISNCPNRCKGCHSPLLMEDVGEILNEQALYGILDKYGDAITCVCFMGGDISPHEVEQLATYVHKIHIKTAWYSGRQNLPENICLLHFDFIKLGPYIELLGGLDSASTNQRFYRIENGEMIEATELFHKNVYSSLYV